MRLAAGRKVERYIIEEPIGEGAMAVVYRARHETLGTQHAIKVLVKATPKVTKRLLAEGRAQARMRHLNIVSVTDVIVIEGQPGLVMEYVEGPTLTALIQHGNLTVDRVDQLAKGILEGAAYAHANAIVHRDIKPSNILVDLTSHGPVPKILDFGLVKFLSDTIGGSMFTASASGTLLGTPYYMAPEQFDGSGELTSAADVWSIGVVIYEMLTGERPFQGRDVLDVMMRIRAGEMPPLREKIPSLTDAHARALEGALQVDVMMRWRNAGEFLAAWCGDIVRRATVPPLESDDEDPWTSELKQRFLASAHQPGPTPLDAAAETLDPGVDWHTHLDTSEVPKDIPTTPQTPLAPVSGTGLLPWVAGAIGLALAGMLMLMPWPADPPPLETTGTPVQPALPAPSAATIEIRGVDARLVRFKDVRGVYPAELPVPAGVYDVLLRNESGEEHVAAQAFAVVSGETYTLACRAKSWVCE